MIWGKSIPLVKWEIHKMLSKALSFVKYEEQTRKRRDLFREASESRWLVFRRKETLWVGVAS